MTKSASESWKHGSEDDGNYSDLSDQSGHAKYPKDASGHPIVQRPKKETAITGKGQDSIALIKQKIADPSVKIGKDIDLKNAEDFSSHEVEGGDDFDVHGDDLGVSRVTPQRAISNISVVSLGGASYNTGDGNSVAGASTDGSYARSARADSIRARLRQQERRLTDLVQRQTSVESTTEGKFKQEMNDVKSNLDKVEQEKYALEQKLEFLKNQQVQDQAALSSHDVTDHDAFLRDKLNGIQRGFQEQASKIQALETEVVSKNAEIDKFRYEIVCKLKRIVELEFDLEMHDIHYTDYANNQFKLGDDALALMNQDQPEGQGKHEESDHGWSEDKFEDDIALSKAISGLPDSEDGGEAIVIEGTIMGERKKLTPKRAQKLIAKLLKDLDHLEATYKKEKLKTVRSSEVLKNENEDLRTKIHVLESEQKQLQSMSKHGKSGMNDVSGYMNIYQLRKRVETLEAKRFLYRKEITRLQDEMKEIENESKNKSHKHDAELGQLQLQLEASNARYKSLVEEKDGQVDGQHENHYTVIEQRIMENYEMVAKLEASMEIKDRQIATLKKEIQQLRLTQIAKAKTGTGYSQIDSDVLAAEKESSRRLNGQSDGEDSEPEENTKADVTAAFVADLQKQLLMAHEQLVKKDQELVIERAKSACMAANLLDRIAELDKEAEKAKRRESMKPSTPSAEKHSSSRERSSGSVDRLDESVRSNRSVQLDTSTATSTGEKKRKPRKSMTSRIPFRFNLPGGKKDGTNESESADV